MKKLYFKIVNWFVNGDKNINIISNFQYIYMSNVIL